ncbi:hypothetical protein M3M33_13745, partial [Loigolactobacillus coryniformis]|uniref:hypothetical protein n=1 Tax=Loigolactobacillus coryniformis TaxID=1610 RepID=UPI00201AE191
VEETKVPEEDAKAKADKAFADWKANEDKIEDERSQRAADALAIYEAGLDDQIEAEKQANAEKQAIWDASWKAFSDIITGMTQIVQNNAQTQ